MNTLGAWRSRAVARLLGAGRDDAEALADWWAVEVLGGGRASLRLRAAEPLALDAEARLEAGLLRLCEGEPLQYLCGVASFHGRPFRCDRRALIPRPETEGLVERALATLRGRPPGARVLDAGTGTGCIAITLALARPDAHVAAVDLQEEALDLARENARRLGARVEFRQGDWLAPWSDAPDEAFDLIVANPPYVARADWEGLSPWVRDREPRSALASGEDGLDDFRRLLPQAVGRLRPGGELWAEHGSEQAPALLDLARQAGFHALRDECDLAGLRRFLYGRRHGPDAPP